jgi:hypothetical protein
MAGFARWLTAVILGIAALTFTFGVLVRNYTAAEMFMTAVGLAVAAIPEGLPTRQMADDGAAVVLLSSDTLELVHACDRVAVFREGRVAATLERVDLSEEGIVAASLGLAGQSVRLAS